MADIGCNSRTWGVHHVKLVARNLSRLRELFTHRFLFEEVFSSTTDHGVVVQRGNVRFLLQQIHSFDNVCIPEGAVDVVFQSSSVDKLAERIVQNGGHLVYGPADEEDENGFIRKAVMESCVPGVLHTIVDTSTYRGPFLPGFQAINGAKDIVVSDEFFGLHFDHLTIACDEGESAAILDWYERCFGMCRFPVNSTISEDEGFIIKHGSTGMKLKALNYWRCMESGVRSVNKPGHELKIVVAEPLSHSGPNQITTFLKENNGPGVQHIGLLTENILSVANAMRSAGLEFMRPPESYYNEVIQLPFSDFNKKKFLSALDFKSIKECCILIDVENEAENDTDPSNESILYQVFTKPLFEKDTFFMELIQRNGAQGFGAANIKALWRAVDSYMNTKEENVNHQSI